MMMWQKSSSLARSIGYNRPSSLVRQFHVSARVSDNLQWLLRIPKSSTEESVHAKLAEFGTIAQFKFPKFSHGGHRNMASVVYENDESAEKLLRAVNEGGDLFGGGVVPLVHRGHHKEGLAERMKRPPARYVTVFGVPLDSQGTSELTSLLSQFGAILNSHIKLMYTGSMDFAHFEFADLASAERAFKAAGEGKLSLNGQKLFIVYMECPVPPYVLQPPLASQRRLLKFKSLDLGLVKKWLEPFEDKIEKIDEVKKCVLFATEQDAFRASHYMQCHPDFPEGMHVPVHKH